MQQRVPRVRPDKRPTRGPPFNLSHEPNVCVCGGGPVCAYIVYEFGIILDDYYEDSNKNNANTMRNSGGDDIVSNNVPVTFSRFVPPCTIMYTLQTAPHAYRYAYTTRELRAEYI